MVNSRKRATDVDFSLMTLPTRRVRRVQEDNISQLSEDCLLDIMTRLDQFDLEEMETVSEKVRDLTRYAHSKARTVEASELTITQRGHNFSVEVVYGKGRYNCVLQQHWIFKKINTYPSWSVGGLAIMQIQCAQFSLKGWLLRKTMNFA
ncbi:hypothetical protein PMAYCL1PPCAC_27620 [Pristionchus mayeri]|uniref:F-box domain-containing protein n=1 Tax=Pristionchus mayeri TaxID=1317129 RepID=A0AAN5D7E2_9BILA|nr:hypothetical protein PMAYCL1PPCAC_27620 [Pristionchus mayeri]